MCYPLSLVFGRDHDHEREERERRRIERLARYNAERERGLVHTEDWRDFMRAEQMWFNDREHR
jgi:hypothetical protein